MYVCMYACMYQSCNILWMPSHEHVLHCARQSISKTVVMHHSAPGKTYIPPSICVYGSKFKVADRFVYLGSTLSSNNTLDNETALQICKDNELFGRLHDRLWRAEEYPLGLN